MKSNFLLFSLFFFSCIFSQEKDTVVVSKNGGDFSTIQEAINLTPAFPYKRLVIFVKNGIYKEKIKIHEWNPNIELLGENRDKTIITFDDYFKKIDLGRNSTFFTPTVLVEANDTVLKNLTIENSAGDIGQAIALSIISKRVGVVNCKILGNQDTLYLGGEGKMFLKDSYIEGTTDFIFGNATAFFENCEIRSKKNSYITAASTPKNVEFGFVFNNCDLSANENGMHVFLGRPWRIFAKTVFINCYLGKHILPEGWENWKKPEAETNSFFAEFGNLGEGADFSKRVKWAHQLNKKSWKKYRIQNVLKDKTNPNWYENL